MTSSPDTLVCDTARIAVWQSDPAYNYNSELVTPDLDLMGWVGMWVRKFMRHIFGSQFAEEYTGIVLAGVAIVIFLLLIWFLYKKRPELFMWMRDNHLPYTIQEDTIYGIDFQSVISLALSRNDFREAIRLLYLQTLKQLSDEDRINWQPYKTPTEYIYEIKLETLRVPFRQLTNSFLRVRYGNFEATESLFVEMQACQKEIEKGGGK